MGWGDFHRAHSQGRNTNNGRKPTPLVTVPRPAAKVPTISSQGLGFSSR